MSLYNDASLVMIPSAVKDGKLYSIRPVEELGNELTTNGDFTTNSDWTLGSSWSIANGKANYDASANGSSIAQSSVFTKDANYKFTFEVSGLGSGDVARIYASNDTFSEVYIPLAEYKNGIHSVYANATSGNTLVIRGYTSGGGDAFSFESVSVKEAIVEAVDFTFSRGSNLAATRVDVNGLIEKGRENLLLQSNQFDTTWSNVNTTETAGQSDKDGGTDAWLLSKSAASARIEQSVSQSGVQTFSLYAKAGTLNWVRLNVDTAWAFYDLSNGVVGSDINNILDHNIYDIGSGWYRCELVVNLSATIARIYPAQNDGDVSGTSGNIVIQDAQLEQGLVATDYIETGASTAQAGILEDLPRLDYSGGASCPSLLLEPSRTNLIPQSEYFGSQTINDATLTNNYASSPEGVLNATRLNQSGTDYGNIQFSAISYSNGVDYTHSIFVKKDSKNYIVFREFASSSVGGVRSSWFNLNDLAWEQTTSVHTTDFEDYGNGWIRLIVTFNAGNTFSRIHQWGQADTDNSLSVANSGSTLFYGNQVESSASYVSSYIPTYGASVSRAADDSVVSSAEDIIDITQGTLFIDATIDSNVDTEIYIMKFDGVNFNDTLYLYRSAIGKIQGVYRIGGSAYKEETTGAISGRFKVVFVYDSNNDCTLYVNGSKAGSSFSIPTPSVNLTAIRLGGFNTTLAKQSGLTHQSLYFPTALTDSECIALTTI